MKTFVFNSKNPEGPQGGVLNAESLEDAMEFFNKDDIKITPDEVKEWDTQTLHNCRFSQIIKIEVSDELAEKINKRKNGHKDV